jgi:cellulose synthase/poly-beta-1,6-N-acetylglucosamine synthase-like glycosyltransferase
MLLSTRARSSRARVGCDVLPDAAISRLERYDPQFCARQVTTPRQRAVFLALAVAVTAAFAAAPMAAASVIATGLSIWFLANAAFRGLLFAAGATRPYLVQPPPLADNELPFYSILVPLYREAAILPSLIRALRALDYPVDRLDIKLIVEADDSETSDALAALDLDACFQVIEVPPGTPRTKPRACNHALPFVRGEFVVIYDAEDRPEPDQLRKAASLFLTSPKRIACLQARLNFYTELYALGVDGPI